MSWDGGPAFPQQHPWVNDSDRLAHAPNGEVVLPGGQALLAWPGVSVLDYFAAKALQAEIITSASDATPESAAAVIEAAERAGRTPMQQMVFNAYEWADAMLVERSKRSVS